MRWRALAGALALALSCLPAHAFPAATQLGANSGTTTAVITTGADAPTGSLIVVVAAVGTLDVAVTSVVDSALNCTSYTGLDNTAVASRPTVAVFYCANTGSDLPGGGTITVTVPSSDTVSATAFALSGMSTTPADSHGHQVNGASGTSATSTATGTLAQANEVVIGALALAGTSSAFNPGTLTSIGGLSATGQSVWAAYQIACSTATSAFAPGWTTSRAYMSDVVSFKTAAADYQCGSKISSYDVLQYGVAASQSASKTNAYVVLQYGSNVSKANSYFVLQNAPASGVNFPLLGVGP